MGRRVVTLLEILRSYADAYAKAASVFGRAGERCRTNPDPFVDGVLLDLLTRQLKELLGECEQSELPLTARHIERILTTIGHLDMHDSDVTGTMGMRLTELQSRLEDELETKLFFQLPHDKRKYFDTPTIGWEEVIARFPETASDVEEMAKCFSLSRYAASVFHGIQSIEVGLIALGKVIGVADPKSGWTAVSGKLATLVVKTKFTDLEPRLQSCYPFLEQMHGTVEALKSAWRNKISHAHGRLAVMTGDFSPDVAEEIMIASHAFMRRLSTEMP